MDPNGRLHMPNGFVGKTFEETGVSAEPAETKPNRKERRTQEAIARHEQKIKELLRS